MTQVQVKSTDVIKLILQFLKENNLAESFETLQRESRTTLNTIDTNQFVGAVMGDRWDRLLQLLNQLMLSQEHLFNAYELIVDDLIEHDRYQAAEFVIKSCIKKHIRSLSAVRERILRLQYIIQNPQEKAVHRKPVSEHRKRQVIKQCLSEVHADVEPARLMQILTQAIKFQSQQGALKPSIKLDLFEGRQKVVVQEQETLIKSIEKVVRFPQDVKVNCIALSWGEELLALGGMDGLIQIYNTIDYSYHSGLKFQAEGTSLFHDHPVTLMQFSKADQILASSDTKGLVKLWNLESGKLLRKIQADTVSSVCWGIDPSHLLVAHQDIRLYGIRGCTVLKEYTISAGADFVHSIFASDGRVMAVTNSGLFKLFSYATQQQLVSTNLRAQVITVCPIYQARGSSNIDRFIIGTPKRIFELSRGGEEEQKWPIEHGELQSLGCVGEFMYEFTKEEKSLKMNVVARSSGKVVYFCSVDKQVNFLTMQRNKNLMITYDEHNCLNFWRQTV